MQKRTHDSKEKLFEELVIDVKSVVKVNKGGRQRRYSATVVVGDRKGKVGLGIGKANEVPDEIFHRFYSIGFPVCFRLFQEMEGPR